jgi:hypothetical protein
MVSGNWMFTVPINHLTDAVVWLWLGNFDGDAQEVDHLCLLLFSFRTLAPFALKTSRNTLSWDVLCSIKILIWKKQIAKAEPSVTSVESFLELLPDQRSFSWDCWACAKIHQKSWEFPPRTNSINIYTTTHIFTVEGKISRDKREQICICVEYSDGMITRLQICSRTKIC